MAKKTGTATFTTEDLEKQHQYVRKLEQQHFAFPLIAAESFVRGMRESGYKSTATALNELIDNAIQAQAKHIDIILGYDEENKSKKKPDIIAIVDDGHGMEPKMIKASVMWGGTHRENDRHGFGRFGFGLPSASVSVARCFSVYSKEPGGKWNVIVIDLDEIAKGRATDDHGVVMVPDPVETKLPSFVSRLLPGGDLPHGTVILLEKLDRLSNGYVTTLSFLQNEAQQVGVTYREMLPREVKIRLIDAGETTDIMNIEPIDPMFIRSDARHYDETEVRAEPLPEARFVVKNTTTGEEKGSVTIRYSYLPPGFMPDDQKSSSPRMKIRKDNTGLMVLRAGRQIDVLRNIGARVGGTSYNAVNNDRHWACEIQFEPALDEEFGVTTNKQQITLSERMLELLKQNGLFEAISQLRKRYGKDHNYKTAKEHEGAPKLSEEIVSEAAKFLARKSSKPSVEKEQKSRAALDREAKKRAKTTGTTPEAAKAEIEAEGTEKPYKIVAESDRGEFYRVEQVGGQKQIFLNTGHRFYSDVYNHPDTPARVKTALELMLFVFGLCELESEGDREMFYVVERAEWTKRLDTYLQLLDRRKPLADAEDSAQAEAETAGDSAA